MKRAFSRPDMVTVAPESAVVVWSNAGKTVRACVVQVIGRMERVAAAAGVRGVRRQRHSPAATSQAGLFSVLACAFTWAIVWHNKTSSSVAANAQCSLKRACAVWYYAGFHAAF